MATRKITFREAINEAMRLEMRRDRTVILFGEDVAGGATLAHMEGENKEAWGGVLGVQRSGGTKHLGGEAPGVQRPLLRSTEKARNGSSCL